MPHPDTQATREHWNRQARTYSESKARNAAYYGALKELFARAVGPEHRGRVLDVGCGTGEILAHLEPRQGLGTDLSEEMIARAAATFDGAANLSFRVLDATKAAGLGPFDAVISADVLEHVSDWQAVVDAIAGACRPGGLIAISTPSPLWALPLWVLEKARLKMPEGPHRWVPLRAIAARLAARDCTIRSAATHLLVPARLFGLGPHVSRWAEKVPLLRRLGVVQLVVAERGGPQPS